MTKYRFKPNPWDFIFFLFIYCLKSVPSQKGNFTAAYLSITYFVWH